MSSEGVVMTPSFRWWKVIHHLPHHAVIMKHNNWPEFNQEKTYVLLRLHLYSKHCQRRLRCPTVFLWVKSKIVITEVCSILDPVPAQCSHQSYVQYDVDDILCVGQVTKEQVVGIE